MKLAVGSLLSTKRSQRRYQSLRCISTSIVSMLFRTYRNILADEQTAGRAVLSLPNWCTEQIRCIASEYCFYVEADESCREAELLEVLKWLLAETFAPSMAAVESFFGTPAR
jgi:hypothetical protein